MVAKLHPVVWAFAGGCLSTATLIGVVYVGFVGADESSIPNDAPSARTIDRYSEPTLANSKDDGSETAYVENDDPSVADPKPSPSPRTTELEGEPKTETGSSIAEVLSGLEIAYQMLAAVPAQPTPAMPPAAPHESSAPHQAAAAAAATAPSTPPANAPAATLPAARVEEADARPMRIASRDDAPQEHNVYYGDVQQNTNVGSVQQGDVYVVPPAVPYAPYYGLRATERSAPTVSTSRPGIPRAVHFTKNPYAAGSGVFNYPVDGPFKYPVDLVH